MAFTLYRSCGAHGPFVVVPDCMKASREAERRYGPLDLLGQVDLQSAPPALRTRIDQQIEARSFALLDDRELPGDWPSHDRAPVH